MLMERRKTMPAKRMYLGILDLNLKRNALFYALPWYNCKFYEIYKVVNLIFLTRGLYFSASAFLYKFYIWWFCQNTKKLMQSFSFSEPAGDNRAANEIYRYISIGYKSYSSLSKGFWIINILNHNNLLVKTAF